MEQDREEDMMIGSPSSDGKMVIKLKIPKLVAAVAMEDEKSPPSNDGKRVCPECKKEFSSGKALGGHMRVHVQSSVNKNPFLKPSKTTKFKKQDFNNGDLIDMKKPYYLKSVNHEGKPTCSQCGKTFPSMKSLFGHMRCHPERIWRGILPPPTTSTPAGVRRRPFVGSASVITATSSSSLSENGLSYNGGDQVVDLTTFLRGWAVTDRRGRPSLKAADDGDGENEDGVLLEAVEDLMSLAHGNPSVTFEGSTSNNNSLKPPVKMEFDDSDSDGRNTNQQSLITHKHKQISYNTTIPNKIKKRKKMKLMMELELESEQKAVVLTGGSAPVVVVNECKYKCTTCNKCFTSHQALGGHRSSHNKSKITSTEEDDYESFVMEKEVEFAGDGTVAPASGITNSNSSNSMHQCKICDKIFPTGQALGGHKRCHWTGTTIEAQAQAPSSQITSTGEGGSQSGSGRKVLDFDLNEIPTMMEEDGNGNGNGYASSSYNSNMG